METGRLKLALSAGALALSMALAGCGGSSSSGPASPSGSGGGGDDPPPGPTATERAATLNSSVEALMMLSAADSEEDSARGIAKKYSGMLNARKTNGNSETAKRNAEMILKARADLMAARDKATADRTAAQTALTTLGEDADASIRSLIRTAIDKAETEIKAADAVLNANFRAAGSLAKYIRDGIEGLKDDNSGTPDDVGKTVAAAIEAAIGNYDGTPATDHYWAFAATGTESRATFAGANVKGSAHDAPDATMTWQEIAGADNVDSELISVGGTATRRGVVSLQGMPVSVLGGTLPATPAPSGSTAIVATGTDATQTYRGIVGGFYCLAADCPVTPATGNIGAGWYFLPTDGNRRYQLQSGETDLYEGAVYAEYGYWLTPATGTGALSDIETFAIAHGGFSDDTLLAVSTTTGAGFRDNNRANYTGKAIGMSVVTGKDGDDDAAALRSGQFTADVSLTANFAGSDGTGASLAWR